MNNQVSEITEPVSIAQTLIALLFVIGLIFLFTYFYRKLSGQSNLGRLKKNTCIQMVSTFPLGNRKFLAIVRVQARFIMLGITPESINHITDLELDGESIEEEKGEFENLFSKILGKIKK